MPLLKQPLREMPTMAREIAAAVAHRRVGFVSTGRSKGLFTPGVFGQRTVSVSLAPAAVSNNAAQLELQLDLLQIWTRAGQLTSQPDHRGSQMQPDIQAMH